MDFKEKAKDVGKHIIGRGDEVRFKNEVLEHEKAHGVSNEEAEKFIFGRRIRNVQTEIASNGIIDSNSKEFKEFKAAAREIFGEEKLRQFSRDGSNPHIFRHITVPPSTSAEVNSVHNYYSKKFGGRTPAHGVLRDSADNTKTIDTLMNRASVRYRGFPRATSLEAMFATNPELGADIGKILDMDDSVKRHEKRFDKDLKFEKAMEGFKETAKDSLAEMFWKAPFECMRNVLKVGFAKEANLGTFVFAFFQQGGIFAKREMVAGGKFFGASMNTLGSLIKNKALR